MQPTAINAEDDRWPGADVALVVESSEALSERATLQSDFRSIGCRIALLIRLSTLLALVWPVWVLAQQSATPDVNAVPATSPIPSAQKQVPDSTKSPGTPAPAAPKTRKLNCRRAATPGKRRFGCKDEEFDWEETMTSDWNGARAEIKKLGITPTASYSAALQTNVSGGPHQVWGYTGQLTVALDFDFDKLLKVSGMSLYMSSSWGTGSNLTATIDSVFPVNTNYAVGAYLGEIYLQQKLLKNNLTLAAGHLAASYTFAQLPVFENYVSFAMNPTPASLVSNDLSYTGPPPGLEWGVQAIYYPTPVVQLGAGVFNTNPYSANNGNVFALQQGNKGALVTAQASYLRDQGPKDNGKIGQYTAGFFVDNNSFATLPYGAAQSNGNAGVFVLGQQMVYRPGGPGTSQGLTLWGAWAYSSKHLVSSMPVFSGAGFSYEGLIKKRKNDTVNAGWIYGKTSRFIPSASAAKLFEANYQWVAKRYLTIVPDFQYIWNTTGTNGSGAAVLGLQATLTF